MIQMLNKFVMLTLLCFTSSIYLCLIVIFCYLSALLSHYISGTIDKSVVYTIAHHLECLAEFYNAYKYSNDQGRVIHVSFVNSKIENGNVKCAKETTTRP